MSFPTKLRFLWIAVAVLAALDIFITEAVFLFIRYSQSWRSGSGAMWASTKIMCFSASALPVIGIGAWAYVSIRDEISSTERFLVRLPFIWFVGMALAFFVVFPFFR
jgi:hypothetical protein